MAQMGPRTVSIGNLTRQATSASVVLRPAVNIIITTLKGDQYMTEIGHNFSAIAHIIP